MVKRVFDFLFSFIALIILLPLFLIISFLIIITVSGPVFFVQPRVGKDGKLFSLYKFRSMKVTKYSADGEFEPGNTTRVTKIGRFMRRSKIDELPQLINVLKGDMSVVGPRPEVEKWVAMYPERWAKVLKVKPGITDIASVLFKNEEYLLASSDDPEETYKDKILPRKLQIYEEYVLNHTFFGDLKIICMTFFHLFKRN